MPIVKCKCGAMTNSALSKYWEVLPYWDQSGEPQANGCWAKWNEQTKQYEKGCIFDEADEAIQKITLEIINRR